MFKKSWKTTSAGITAIAGVIVGIVFAPAITAPLIMASVPTLLLGIGLLFSKDSDVTGGTTPSTPEAAERLHQ